MNRSDSHAWERARKLAGLAHTEGPEGQVAVELLRRLVKRHPQLRLWLDENATEFVQIEAPATGCAEVALLLAVVNRAGLEIQIEDALGEGIPLGRYFVLGQSAAVRACIDDYQVHRGVLLCLSIELVERYIERALRTELVESEPDEESKSNTSAPIPAHVLAMADDYDLATRVRDRLGSRLQSGIASIIDVVVPPDEPVAYLFDGEFKCWDSVEFTAEDLWVLYRQLYPNGSLERWWVEQRYELGWRLHPVSRRWRRLRKLATNPPWDEVRLDV